MKFEVEKKSHKKGWIIAISTILILGIVLVVKNSFAFKCKNNTLSKWHSKLY